MVNYKIYLAPVILGMVFSASALPKDLNNQLACGLSTHLSCSKKLLLIVKLGACVNTCGEMGLTLLAKAVEFGDITTVQEVLSLGADPNVCGADGVTPLHRAAASFMPQSLLITQLLLQSGACPCSKNNNGQTPLDIARLLKRYDTAAVIKNKQAIAILLEESTLAYIKTNREKNRML